MSSKNDIVIEPDDHQHGHNPIQQEKEDEEIREEMSDDVNLKQNQNLLVPINSSDDNKTSRINEYDKAITPRFKRIFILISTMIETIIFSGLIFGWPALFYMLKNEKIYSHLCQTTLPLATKFPIGNISMEDGATDVGEDILIQSNDFNETFILKKDNCIPQENILNLAFTIGIFSMGFTSFAWGFLLESKGLRFVRIALNILISLGCFLLSMTTSDISVQIIPAIIILGLIGVPLRIANMQIADFFPLKRSTIITFFSGAFSSSPVVFVLIKYSYDNLSLSYFWSTFILFIISITLLPLNTILLPKLSVRSREKLLLERFDEYYTKISALDNLKKNERENSKQQQQKPHFVKKKLLKSVSDRFAELDITESLILSDNLTTAKNNKKPIIVNFSELQREKHEKKMKSGGFLKKFFKPTKTGENDVPLRVSLLSLSFLMHQLWFSWINTYMVLYSGSMALWLDRVTQDPRAKNEFTQAFGLVQITALIIAPLAGFVMDFVVYRAQSVQDANSKRLIQAQSGFWPILFTTLILVGAVWCRFFDTPLAVNLSIGFITILRALFIAVASAYLRVRYPASHFNRLNGIMCTTGAFFSLLQFPLFYFESKSDSGAFWVNTFCAIMTLISLLNPLCLRITSLQKHYIRMEQKHGQKIQEEKRAIKERQQSQPQPQQ